MVHETSRSQGSGVRSQDAASPDLTVGDVAAGARACSERIAEHYRGRAVTIEIPIGPLGDGHEVRHVDCQLRTGQQREAMRRMFTGLDLCGARTRNDKRVTNNVQAVLWLLEQVAAAIDSKA